MQLCLCAVYTEPCDMALSTEVKTPDFEACMVQNDTNNSAMKPLRFSKKGLSVSTTSAPASLFNSPETLQSPLNESLTSCHELIPYTQHLEETVIEKYAAVKEVFNNLSGDETESSESRPSSPLSPPIIPAFPARNIPARPKLPPLLPETLLDDSCPVGESQLPGSPLSPPIIPAVSARNISARPILPSFLPETLLDDSGPIVESQFPGSTCQVGTVVTYLASYTSLTCVPLVFIQTANPVLLNLKLMKMSMLVTNLLFLHPTKIIQFLNQFLAMVRPNLPTCMLLLFLLGLLKLNPLQPPPQLLLHQ